MKITFSSARKFGLLVAFSSLIISAASQEAAAQAPALSDELLITGPEGAPVLYDTLLPEGGAAGAVGAEGSLTFGPTLPAVTPPGALGPFIGAPGATYVILTEEAGFVPDPSELPPPIWIGPDGQQHFVSDVLINGLANQAGLPPFIALVSDNNPDLERVVGLLPPTTPFLAETGALQNLTPFMGPTILPGFGPVQVQVRSDVPEPSTFVLFGLAIISLVGFRLRKRFA
jgi:hypothetical protein